MNMDGRPTSGNRRSRSNVHAMSVRRCQREFLIHKEWESGCLPCLQHVGMGEWVFSVFTQLHSVLHLRNVVVRTHHDKGVIVEPSLERGSDGPALPHKGLTDVGSAGSSLMG